MYVYILQKIRMQFFVCFLCCVMFTIGGALKPTDIDNLWVHVICAWFRPEVAFVSDEKMEPATGLLRIPPDSFVKVGTLLVKN